MISLAVMHFMFGFVILVYEAVRIKRRGGFDFFSLIVVVFAIFYGLAPTTFHVANAVGYEYAWTDYAKHTQRLYPLSFLLAVISYLCLRAGWTLAGSVNDSQNQPAGLRGGAANEQALTTKMVVTAWLLLATSLVAYYLYSLAYGGFDGLAIVSNALRAGWAEVSNPWSFLKRFGGLTIVASYLFMVAMRTEFRGLRRHSARLGFALSTLFSLYVLLTWQGRLTLAFYVLTLILADAALKQRRIGISTLALPVAAVAFLLFAGNDLLYLFRQLAEGNQASVFAENPGLESAHDFVLGELSFPIVSINTALNAIYNGAAEMRFFVDIPLGILSLIPQRWLLSTIETASTVNTKLIDPSLPGTVPTDLISFGVYSLGAFGPPVVSFVMGALARVTQHFVGRIRPAGLGAVFFIAYGLTIARSVAYADPAQILEGSFYLLLGTAITLIVLRIRIGGAHGP